MNNAINLLPCPMCGCNSITIKNEQPTDNSGGYFIECPDCGTSTSLRYACGDDPMPLLAEQWNRRTSTQHLHQIAEPAQAGEPAVSMLTFVNGEPAKCGCRFSYSDGGGEYSNVGSVTLCAKHAGHSTERADPFMWAIQEPGGGAYMDDGCVSSVREDVQAEVDGLNSGLDADDDPYQVVPVYLAAAPQATAHPDDAAVDALAAMMKAKLALQRAKGYGGWDDKTLCPQQRLSDMLRAHVDKGDPVDVANFCAMLSARGEGIAAAPQAVQAAVPEGWKLAPIKVPDSAFAWVSGGYPAGFKAGDKRDTAVVHKRAQRTWEAILNGITAPAHPAEGVTARASEWDGKLPERLQSVLNALRLELPAAVVNDVEFEVRSHYEAMHTSLSTSRRMYGAARDRLEAIDAAQPDPFAATQPAEQGMEALPMQASEGVEDVAVMEHPEWMLVHKETGAQKPLDSQWTVRATQPAAQGAATTGYIAPKSRYVPPVLFSPYTGEPRDARDIASDPRGILIVPPGAALAAQAKQGGA